jgi:protein-tyrosine phosphatase
MVINNLPIQNSYWVIPNRFKAGEHPGRGSVDGTRLKLHWLIGLGINYILDLTETGESDINYPLYLRDEANSLNIEVTYKRVSIQDWFTPSQEKMIEILDTIDLALSEGKNIYIHCFGGRGRTGMVVGCYLVRHGTPGDHALERIQELRKDIPGVYEQSPETDKQRKMVIAWTER